MAIRKVREEGDEILKKKSKEVEVIDDKIKQLIEDMVETMHAYDGVGLAAVQVGILKRILVIDLYDGSPIVKLINPLSFPNKYVKVKRPMEVTVEGLNENGEKIKITGKELLAQALSHEVDHLNGIVLTDVMIPGSMEYITPDNKNTESKKKRGK